MGEMLKECTHAQQINKAWGPNTLCKDYVQQNCIINIKPTERIDLSYSTTRRNFVVVIQSLSRVQLFATPWTTVHQAFLSFITSQSLLRFMSIESVMTSNYLIICRPLLLLPSILPSIRVFSNESALCIRWPKYWSSSFSISPSNEYSGLISFRLTDLISLQSNGLSSVFSSTTILQHGLLYGPALTSTCNYWKNNSFDYTDVCRLLGAHPPKPISERGPLDWMETSIYSVLMTFLSATFCT